ncbi:MAG: DsbA family protein [Saprospiraceae bacterium]|nr:DsbA family protein [Saprospiraceae bacterium]
MPQVSNAQKDTLIYIGDPMCSWCYGFSRELDKIRAEFPEVPFEMVMGGLRAGGTETIGELSDFLYHHWIEVQKTSGTKINFSILKESDIMYDSEPACRAVIVANKLKPGISYEYFKAAQESFYFHNNLPNDIDTYINLAVKFGINPEKFHKLFIAKQSQADTYSEFDLASAMGVKGFPSLIAKIDGKLYIVTSGYQKADRIIKLLHGRGL